MNDELGEKLINVLEGIDRKLNEIGRIIFEKGE